MNNFKPVEDYIPEYWEGGQNLIVRLWVYLNRGLDFINQARYWIIGILGLYAVLKLTNPIWMGIFVIISTPVLIVVGRWHLYRVSKTQEYIVNKKGTVTGYQGFNMQVRTVELLEEINNKINERLHTRKKENARRIRV